MRKAIEIANFLLELFKFDEEGLTNLKLNKLLYFAQGFSYQRLGKPLFADEIEAWSYGPVVSEVYKIFQPCGRNPITPTDEIVELSSEEEELLIDVAREYGRYSASGLVSMTHKAGTPWSQVYKQHENKVISQTLIKDYFIEGEDQLPMLELNFNESDFAGHRDEEGYLVLPKEYNEQ